MINGNEYKNYEIEHYDFISKCRVNGKGGGVGIYIANKLNWIRRSDLELEGIECIWIELIIKKSSNILVSSFYRPPESSEYLPKNFNSLFSDMLMKVSIENKESVILRDINADYLDKKKNIDLKNTLTINGYKQVITKATCVTKDSSTLLDIIASNKPNNISHSGTIPASLSDHDMVVNYIILNTVQILLTVAISQGMIRKHYVMNYNIMIGNLYIIQIM